MDFCHVSILLPQCITSLQIDPNGIYVDATAGGGGHSFAIAGQLEQGRLYCFDRDSEAIKAAGEKLAPYKDKVIFCHSDFANLRKTLSEHGVTKVNGILFDLGVSSYQLDTAERGFSYMQDGPLDMRMDQRSRIDASAVINTYPEEKLRQIFWDYGEERYASRIARQIAVAREEKKIETTLELVDIIKTAMPAEAKKEKQHPAKRVFQAVRIEVNDELNEIKDALTQAVDLLDTKGRLAVISFHSLEDRIVKNVFQQEAKGCTCPPDFPVCVCGKKPRIRIVTRRPVLPDEQEIETNPRSRSAKLRVAEKI